MIFHESSQILDVSDLRRLCVFVRARPLTFASGDHLTAIHSCSRVRRPQATGGHPATLERLQKALKAVGIEFQFSRMSGTGIGVSMSAELGSEE
jgi:hypothetical protein